MREEVKTELETKEKKNLLITTDNFLPRWDGIARFLLEIIPFLKEYYNITVLAPDFAGEFEGWSGVKVIRLPLFLTISDLPIARPLRKVIKQEIKKADIIFNQTIGPIGAVTIHLAKRLKKKVISYIHNIEWELVIKSLPNHLIFKKLMIKLSKKIVSYFYNKCHLLLVPFEEVGDMLRWNKITTKTKTVPLGVDTNEFSPPAIKAAAKKRIGLNPADLIIGFHGRLGREKDLPTLFRAFYRLEKKIKHLKLLVVGEGLKSIKEQAKKHPHIIMAGQKERVAPYVQAMDIYVLSSLTETTSLTTLEAMACGVPVVCTPVGFVKYYLKEGKNGFLFRKRKSYELFKKLELLITHPALREEMGKKARETVLAGYSWETTFLKTKEILDAESGPVV